MRMLNLMPKLMEVIYETSFIIYCPTHLFKWMGGVFFVNFFVAIPSLIMFFKPHLPSPCERVGGALFLVKVQKQYPKLLYVIFYLELTFEHWVLTIPSSCVLDFLSFYAIPSPCVFYLYPFTQYLILKFFFNLFMQYPHCT